MLVLSRKLGESIEIGDNKVGDNKVIVRVLGIRRSKVQLGVDAPPDVAIHRSETAEKYIKHDPEQTQLRSPIRTNALEPRDRDLDLGDSILDDLARIQAEIAALAELVPGRDRLVARQIAAEAVERLASIERTVRYVRRRSSEQPIAAFVGSRSLALQEMHCQDSDETASHSEVAKTQSWSDRCDDSATLIRESSSPFHLATSPCTFA